MTIQLSVVSCFGIIMNYSLVSVAVLFGLMGTANASSLKEYTCTVDGKRNGDQVYSSQEIRSAELQIIVRDSGKKASLGRCSFSSSEGRVACKFSNVDKIVRDDQTGMSKFSSYRAKFDVELYSDGSFLERDGQGSIAYGKCQSY